MSSIMPMLKGLGLAVGGGIVAVLLTFIVVLAIIAGAVGGIVVGEQGRRPATDVVLVIDLRRGMPDMARPSAVPFFSNPGFVGVVNRLHRAVSDERVKGVFVRVGTRGPGSARAEELRAAFAALKAAGKFVVAHSQGFGIGPSGYRSVSIADQIVLQPGSEFSVSGLMLETLFLKDMFGKIDVIPDLIAIGAYKNAPDSLTRSDFTAAHAEALRTLGQSIWNAALTDIAADRGMEMDRLRNVLDQSPHSDVEALDTGLIDSLSWPEETLEAALERQGACDNTCESLDISAYVPPAVDKKAPVLAIIGGEGAIVTGGGDVGGTQFVSDQIADELNQAAMDEDVQAVIFRVDSPGGSVDASEQVWRAVERIRDSGKPVIVSMGPLAASGGYYVSMGADAIVANGATLTGSIGVYGGKLATGGGMRKLGVEPRRIVIGGHFASVGSTETYSPDQRRKVTVSLNRIYDRFVDKAAQGRRLPREQVDAAAQGRVWTGVDALERGLVDEIGGFVSAIDKALELAGLEIGQEVRLRRYTRADDPFELLQMLMSSGASVAGIAAILQILVDAVGDPGLDHGAQARMTPVTVH